MCISDTDSTAKQASKTAFVYLIVSILCGLFGAIYEVYSHEVYSFYMIYAFAFPLIGGTLPFSILSMTRAKRYPNMISRKLYHSGIATLTVGSLIRGVLDIYGTTNSLTEYYWHVGVCFVVAGIFMYGIASFKDWNNGEDR